MAGGRGARKGSRPRARAESVVAPFPRGAVGDRLELGRLLPSGRSILTGLVILLTALGLYAAARTTSAFAIEQVAVEGATPEVAADVRKALETAAGESLLGLDLDDLARRAESVPMVAEVTFDRAFPHTLRVGVVPEVPVAVLRQGGASWLVAAGGRVVAVLDKGARPALPRVWLKRDVEVRLGEQLAATQLRAVRAVAPLVRTPLPVGVRSADAGRRELTLTLRNGVELRLGNGLDLPVKLEVARRILPLLEPGTLYLDVSVPDRPIASTTLDSKVEVESSTSTTP